MTRRNPDVVIVGGGVMGLSIAFHLCRLGVRPLVLERAFLGAGSTGKSGAICRQHYSLEFTARMARDSLKVYAEFEERVGGSAGFVRTGMALLVRPDDRDGLVANVEMQRSLGITTGLLDPSELREAVPGALIEEDAVGCFEPDAGYADPLRTLRSLARAIRRLGGEVREAEPVTDLRSNGERVTGVATADEEFSADQVVVCAGPWTSMLLERIAVDAEVQAVRVQSAVFRRPPGFEGGPVVIDFVNEMYAKHASETHVGSIDPAETETVHPESYDQGVADSYLDLAYERLCRRLPVMRQAISFGGYGALYATTPDWHPIIGPAGPDGLYVCAGFSGHGFKLAPSVGATVASELLSEPPPYDFSPLRPDRFRRGDRVGGRYSYSILG